MNIDKTAITPLINSNQTQIIFQRHCGYDRNQGKLKEESIEEQIKIVNCFIEELKNDKEELQNMYFLFTASNTVSPNNLKRCVETTKIAMNLIEKLLKENNIPISHIMNLNENLNYKNHLHEDKHLIEPKIFIDNTGFLEYLKEKYGKNFFIAYENDDEKEMRLNLGSEGPDEIVDRGVFFINACQKYAEYFHKKNPNSKLFIWNGTHYDLINPLVKQRILFIEKTSIVNVSYCGGISLIINEENKIMANLNGTIFPIDAQYNLQHPKHL